MFWIDIKECKPSEGMVVLGMTDDGPMVVVWRKTCHVPLYGWHPYWCLPDGYDDDIVKVSMYVKIPR